MGETHSQLTGLAYDAGLAEEYERLSPEGPSYREFLMISSVLDAFIPRGSSVLDCGCGPGRYSRFLMRKACKVGMMDVSGKSLDFCLQKTPPGLQARIVFRYKQCATELKHFPAGSFDAILLMGPLYHLVLPDSREAVVHGCYNALKKGGSVFTVFLNPENHVSGIPQFESTSVMFAGYKIPQFRCTPVFASSMFRRHGFLIKKIVAIPDNEMKPDNLNNCGSQYLLIASKP